MTVNIQSKSCGSMSQVSLHRFDIISVLEGQYCECMSQVMYSCRRDSNSLNYFFEMVANRGLRKMFSVRS